MLRLDFPVFQDKLKKEKSTGFIPTVHCSVNTDSFIFVIKSQEKWEYYTIMPFSDIIDYAESNDMTENDAFDMFTLNYCSGTLPFLPPKIEEAILTESSESENELNLIEKLFNTDLDPGDEIVKEATDYSSFLLLFFNHMEKKILNSVESIEVQKIMYVSNSNINIPQYNDSSMICKNFGDFMTNLYNNVNSILFAKTIKKFIRGDLMTGMMQVEEEYNVDIGFTDEYELKLNQLQAQQIDGYLINGKKWPGIKGVTKELQASIIQTVQNGVKASKTHKEIKEDIKSVFGGFSDWKANMIGRTETTRIINEGLIIGYKELGIPGKKRWVAAIDNRTSPVCRRLNKQTVELDDDFIDPETKKAYSSPPSHPYCRSRIIFVPNEKI